MNHETLDGVAGLIIDLTRSFKHAWMGRLPTGIDRLELEYLRHFNGRARALLRLGRRWIFLNGQDSRELFQTLLSENGISRLGLVWLAARACLPAWRSPPAGALLLNTGHVGLQHKAYASRVRRHGLRPVYFLHDLIPVLYGEYCNPKITVEHHRRLTTMLDTASALLVNSHQTGRDLDRYASAQGRKAPAWTVAALGPGRLQAQDGPRPLVQPYFVMLSTIEPRKNHLLLLHVWRELASQLGALAPRLVVIGRRGWECEQVVDMLDRCAALRGLVIELPRCTDHDLTNWLAHAQALLFPSFTEGYGLPLVEALSLGTPAIVSDIDVFRAIAENIPEYVSPIDGPGWKRAILEYMDTGSAARQAQIARMAGYQPPTWDAHFQVVEKLLMALSGRQAALTVQNLDSGQGLGPGQNQGQ